MDSFRHSMPLRVLIVDDHAIIRRGLREVIKHHWTKSVHEEAGSCAEILPALRRSVFDLVLLDLQLEDGNSIDLLERIKVGYPHTRILVYSMGAERVFAQQALSLGATGFLSKATDEGELLIAIERVLSGGLYMSQELKESSALRRSDRNNGQIEDPFDDLSERESRVMMELLTGAGVKEIAARLGLQPTTVATYKARLFDKLGVTNLIDLQTLVTTRGYVQAERTARASQR